MALNTTGSADLSVEMKTFYDRLLLERTVPTLIYTKFAQERNIPRHGGKTIEFRRFSALPVATTPLTEGTPPTLKDIEVTSTTATVAQYGDAVGFSDLVSTTTIDPLLQETVEILAEEARETIDELVRDVLVAGTVVVYASTAVSRITVSSAMTLTPADIRDAVLELKINRARKINGWYHALIHPRVAHDLMETTEWREANQFAGSSRIFSGALGQLYGVMFHESDKAKVFTGAGASGIDVYATIILGQNAFGMVKLAGHNLQTFYKPLGSAGSADPINQQQSMGWKVTFTTKILNDDFMVRVESAVS